MKRIRVLSSLVLVTCVLGATLVATAGAAANPVLGAKSFAAPYGKGFGTAEPSEIFNGGDPSGSVTHIKWSGWGNPTAIGYGLNPIFKPHGGYYRPPPDRGEFAFPAAMRPKMRTHSRGAAAASNASGVPSGKGRNAPRVADLPPAGSRAGEGRARAPGRRSRLSSTARVQRQNPQSSS